MTTIKTSNPLAIRQFMERQNNPLCKHCGKHTEKFRRTNKNGNVCTKCQELKNSLRTKTWYYQKKGWVELVKKMNRQYYKLFGTPPTFSGSLTLNQKIS